MGYTKLRGGGVISKLRVDGGVISKLRVMVGSSKLRVRWVIVSSE